VDASNNIFSRGLWNSSGAGTVSTYASSAPTTGMVLTATNSTTGTWQAIPSSGVTSIAGTTNEISASASTGAVTLSVPSTFIAPGSVTATTTLSADATTNQIVLGVTNTTTLNAPAPASSTTLTLPISSDSLIGRSTTDSLTNKSLTSSTNNVTAQSLFVGSGSNTVSTYASSLGTTGQVLTMATPTTAAFTYTPSVTGMQLNFYNGSSGALTLTLSSAYCQYITGSTALTITMPGGTGAASTGAYEAVTFWIINNSSATVTVNSSGGNLIKSVATLTAYWFVQQITGTSTAATVWTSVGPLSNAL